MDANKPTFDSLSPERVNALIAEKVMGWHKEFYRYGAEPEYVSPYESWVDAEGVERKQVLHSIYAQCSCSVFTPMTLLDDCWLVEEKMLSTPLNVFDSFLQQLSEIVIRDLGGFLECGIALATYDMRYSYCRLLYTRWV